MTVAELQNGLVAEFDKADYKIKPPYKNLILMAKQLETDGVIEFVSFIAKWNKKNLQGV